MAAIEKLYGTIEQYDELHKWLTENKPEYLIYLNDRDKCVKSYIALFSCEADAWLLEFCPLQFVRTTIMDQYDIRPFMIDEDNRLPNYNN